MSCGIFRKIKEISRMKVVINILHTVKYTDRIERLASGGIRSKDHSVKVRILADGPRPHNAPQSWE